MNFSEEKWVKLYKRNTVTWRKIGWDARCVFMHLIRVVDSSGVFECTEDIVGDLSTEIEAPLDVTKSGLENLSKYGVVMLLDSKILIPRYIEAQQTPKSDKLRQQEARERKRDGLLKNVTKSDETSRAVTKSDETVTKSDEVSQKVTKRHAVSRGVTTRLDETSLDETSLEKTPLSDFGNPTAVGGEKKQTPANEVFEFWKETFGKNAKTIFDAKRRYAVEKQLRNGFSVEDLKLAVVGCSKSPHHMGENDRGEKYNDLELICRDAPRVEKFIEIASGPAKASAKQEAEVWR